MAITKQDWAEQCCQFREMIDANDDDLRSFTLGAIRAAARNNDDYETLHEIRAILAGLDHALNCQSHEHR